MLEEGEVEPLIKFSKRGLDRTLTFRGGLLGKRRGGGGLLEGDYKFLSKNIFLCHN